MAEAALAQADSRSDNGSATAALRQIMVDRQLRTFDVTDLPLLRQFLNTPREIFLPHDLAPLAYSDLPLVLKGEDGRPVRRLLPPLILARLLQEAQIRETEKVLIVGGATGYSAAIVAGLAAHVVLLESDPRLAAGARSYLQALGVGNASVENGPLPKGAPAAAPFDVIVVEGAVEDGLDDLLAQLTDDGRLIAIARPDPESGWAATLFERSAGKPAGSRALFDASAPVLEGFEKAQGFVF
jgi:protein-L-isoaspartate(D-aspartate) O-methyltransferase